MPYVWLYPAIGAVIGMLMLARRWRYAPLAWPESLAVLVALVLCMLAWPLVLWDVWQRRRARETSRD